MAEHSGPDLRLVLFLLLDHRPRSFSHIFSEVAAL